MVRQIEHIAEDLRAENRELKARIAAMEEALQNLTELYKASTAQEIPSGCTDPECLKNSTT